MVKLQERTVLSGPVSPECLQFFQFCVVGRPGGRGPGESWEPSLPTGWSSTPGRSQVPLLLLCRFENDHGRAQPSRNAGWRSQVARPVLAAPCAQTLVPVLSPLGTCICDRGTPPGAVLGKVTRGLAHEEPAAAGEEQGAQLLLSRPQMASLLDPALCPPTKGGGALLPSTRLQSSHQVCVRGPRQPYCPHAPLTPSSASSRKCSFNDTCSCPNLSVASLCFLKSLDSLAPWCCPPGVTEVLDGLAPSPIHRQLLHFVTLHGVAMPSHLGCCPPPSSVLPVCLRSRKSVMCVGEAWNIFLLAG